MGHSTAEKSIVIIGALDTKGDQLEYLIELVEKEGYQATVVDIGVMGDVPFKPAISREQVVAASGTTLEALIELRDECKAMDKMAEGASKLLTEHLSEASVSGILAVGGSMGTDAALRIMEDMTIGLPKLIVSTVAYSPMVTPDRVENDIMMLPWVAGLWGLNSLSRETLQTAAGTITGAAKAYLQRQEAGKKTVAISSLGQTICRYVARLKPALEERGYEVAVFHTTGMSGRILEKAISQGRFVAVLDLDVGTELVNEVTDGYSSAGERRLQAAGKKGIPQIVSPGHIEVFTWATGKPVPSKYKERPQHTHNHLLHIVVSSIDERVAAARLMAQRLNASKGPVKIVIPMDGLTKANVAIDEVPDDPFLRATFTPQEGLKAFVKELQKELKPEIEVKVLECGGNDPPYAVTVLECFDDMMGIV